MHYYILNHRSTPLLLRTTTPSFRNIFCLTVMKNHLQVSRRCLQRSTRRPSLVWRRSWESPKKDWKKRGTIQSRMLLVPFQSVRIRPHCRLLRQPTRSSSIRPTTTARQEDISVPMDVCHWMSNQSPAEVFISRLTVPTSWRSIPTSRRCMRQPRWSSRWVMYVFFDIFDSYYFLGSRSCRNQSRSYRGGEEVFWPHHQDSRHPSLQGQLQWLL